MGDWPCGVGADRGIQTIGNCPATQAAGGFLSMRVCRERYKRLLVSLVSKPIRSTVVKQTIGNCPATQAAGVVIQTVGNCPATQAAGGFLSMRVCRERYKRLLVSLVSKPIRSTVVKQTIGNCPATQAAGVVTQTVGNCPATQAAGGFLSMRVCKERYNRLLVSLVSKLIRSTLEQNMQHARVAFC